MLLRRSKLLLPKGPQVYFKANYLLRQNPLDRRGPGEVLISSFARNYIPFDSSWIEQIVNEGIVIWPQKLACTGRHSAIPIFLLWLKSRGFTGISLLVSEQSRKLNRYRGLVGPKWNSLQRLHHRIYVTKRLNRLVVPVKQSLTKSSTSWKLKTASPTKSYEEGVLRWAAVGWYPSVYE